MVQFFGTDFSVYAPILMLLFAGFTLGRGYAHVIRALGLEQAQEFIPGNPEHEAKIRQGEVLIAKAREKMRSSRSVATPVNPAAQSLLDSAF